MRPVDAAAAASAAHTADAELPALGRNAMSEDPAVSLAAIRPVLAGILARPAQRSDGFATGRSRCEEDSLRDGPGHDQHEAARQDGQGRRLALGGLAAFLAAYPLVGVMAPAPTVRSVAIDNPTDYDLTVAVSDDRRRAWAPLATAKPAARATVREVLDVGPVWVFRFLAQGVAGGELRLDRAELEARGWRVRAPDAVAEQLSARGAPPSP